MSDIFSILTRGTNLKRRREDATIRNAPVTTAVQAANGSKRANKRKRKAEKTVDEDADIPNELDFFGVSTKPVKEKKGKKSKQDGESDGESGSDEEVESEDGDEMEQDLPQLSEEDKRRILRENKLKIQQIYPLPEVEKVEVVETDKKKKKKKKAKVEEEEKKKKKNKYPQAIVTPLQSFSEMRPRYQLSRRVCENVASRGYAGPTQVQIGALPLLLDTAAIIPAPSKTVPVNLLVCAPTGSGKTLAFTLPLLSEILRKRKENDGKLPGPYALILAPTKELAAQIVNEIRKFAKGTGIRATLVRKGVDIHVVKSHILVGTPGVLANEVKDGEGLPTVKQLILDEADVMLDEMFREQTVAVWNACKLGKGSELRVSLWSATMPSSTETLAKELIIPAEDLKARKKQQPVIYRLTVGIQSSSLPNVHHELTYAATEQGKLLALRQIINSPEGMPTPVLIFTQTIPRAAALQSELLYDLPQQGRVHVLHSSLSETQRTQTMDKFRAGEIWLLITTDLLSRGVDFAGVKLVINYDIPTSVASFIHRVGRTARGGSEGKAVTFYTKEDIPYVRNIVGVVQRAEGGQDWLMNALPKVGKREKQKLKKHGVDARKEVKITTKSAWERRKNERKKGAKEGSKRRKELEDAESDSDGEVEGHEPLAIQAADSDDESE